MHNAERLLQTPNSALLLRNSLPNEVLRAIASRSIVIMRDQYIFISLEELATL